VSAPTNSFTGMLDLDHLSHQTSGNLALEREVLDLFVAQIDLLIGRLQSSGTQTERSEAAHIIVGSAAAIGAFEVEGIARRIESSEKSSDSDIAELVAAIEQTRTFIAAHLAR
jgi:HPt (histidine-containing phosphotransfer) domain-containing protein